MPKQYEHALLEVEVKRQLEAVRNELDLRSLSATIIYLVDHFKATTPKKK